MKENWFKRFWDAHGDRLIFASLALGVSYVLYNIDLKAEAKTILIGIGMLLFNKARGANNK